MSIFISVIALVISTASIIVSIVINNKNLRFNLFDERYRVYFKFVEIYVLTRTFLHEGFTYKGKVWFWNINFNGIGSETSNLGNTIIAYKEALKNTESATDEYKKFYEELDEAKNQKMTTDYAIKSEIKSILTKSKFVFSKEISDDILNFYEDFDRVSFEVNLADEKRFMEIVEQLENSFKRIQENKTIEKMEEYLLFNNK